MKNKLLLVLVLILFSLSLSLTLGVHSSLKIVYAQGSLGCCINDQTGLPNSDFTCNEMLSSQCPAGSTYVAGVPCSQVPQCGCCVANPSSQTPQIYDQGNLLTTSNFCKSVFPNTPTIIIANKTPAQCQALIGTGPITSTTIPTSPAPPTSSSFGVGNITITVRSGGVAIQNVGVKLSSVSSPSNAFSDVTSSSGSASFIGISTGTYTLSSSGCGYIELTQEVTNTNANDLVEINLNLASKENIVIDTLDSSGNLISGATFKISPNLVSSLPSSQNGKATISGVPSNCEYNVTGIYQGSLLTNKITISSKDNINFNPMQFKFPSAPASCQNTLDCRGLDGVLGSQDDCTQFCQSGEQCNPLNGVCEVQVQQNCCQYEF